MAAPAQAGSIGVTNSWGHSSRSGGGTTAIEVRGSSQTAETSSSWASKTETGSATSWGPTYSTDSYSAASGSTMTRNFTAQDRFSQTTNEGYGFSSTNFSHTVSTFAE